MTLFVPRHSAKVFTAVIIASTVLSATLAAQASEAVAMPKSARNEVAVQLSVIPLYAGHASVGRSIGAGPSLRLTAFRGGHSRGSFLEAAYTATRGDESQGKPRLDLATLSIGWRAAPEGQWYAGDIGRGTHPLLRTRVAALPCAVL